MSQIQVRGFSSVLRNTDKPESMVYIYQNDGEANCVSMTPKTAKTVAHALINAALCAEHGEDFSRIYEGVE